MRIFLIILSCHEEGTGVSGVIGMPGNTTPSTYTRQALNGGASYHFQILLMILDLCFQKKERVPSSVCVFVLKA